MNKKIVVIVVIIECILAVLLISFFGQAIFKAQKNIECNEIYFVYENGEKIEDGKTIEVELSDTNRSYQLRWKLDPEKVSNKNVRFVSSKSEEYVIVDEYGFVTFLQVTDVEITIQTLDGSNKTDTIVLIPKRKTEGSVT